MMNNIENLLKQVNTKFSNLEVTDWAMIVFFSSRFFTWVFTLFLGSRGIIPAMGILLVLYIVSIIKLIKNKKTQTLKIFILMALIIMLATLVTMLLNPQAKEWILSFNQGFITSVLDFRKGLFAALVILMVANKEKILENLQIASIFSAIYLSIQLLMYFVNGNWQYYYVLEDSRSVALSYNLHFGYEAVFVAIIMMAYGLYRKSKPSMITGIVFSLIAFIFGSRGILIPLGSFVILVLTLELSERLSKETKKKILYTLGILTVLLIVFVVISNLVGGIRTGIRNIDMFLSQNFLADSGRVRMWRNSLSSVDLIRYPFGRGVFGDRPFAGQTAKFGYSHNVFVEMLTNFGVLGILLLAGIIYACYKNIKRGDKNVRLLFYIFIAMNMKLLISDSFWFYDSFWALIALIIVSFLHSPTYEKFTMKFTTGRFLKMGTTIVSLILVNSILVVAFLKTDIDHQKHRAISFDEPTAHIYIRNTQYEQLIETLDVLQKYEVVASVYLTNEELKEFDVQYLLDHYDIEVHFSLTTENLMTKQTETIQDQIDEFNEKVQLYNDNSITSVGLQEAFVHADNNSVLRDNFDSVVLPLSKDSYPQYSVINERDMYEIQSINISMNVCNERNRFSRVADLLDETIEDNTLISMNINNVQEYYNCYLEPVISAPGDVDFFETLIEEYHDKFNFITTSDLVSETLLLEGENSFEEYFFSNDIIQRVFQRNKTFGEQ